MPKIYYVQLLQKDKTYSILRNKYTTKEATSTPKESFVYSYAYHVCSRFSKLVKFDYFIIRAKQFSLYWALVPQIPGRNQR